MASKLEVVARGLEDAAKHSEERLHRPEMNFTELCAHLRQLGEFYRQQLAHKALVAHRRFSVTKFARRRIQPLTKERLQQLREAGRKGGSVAGSGKKAQASKVNAAKRWQMRSKVIVASCIGAKAALLL